MGLEGEEEGVLGLIAVRRLVVLVVWARRCAPHPCRHHLVIVHRCRLVIARRCHVWVFVRVGFGAFVLCGVSLALGACRGCHVAQWQRGCGRRAAWCGW